MFVVAFEVQPRLDAWDEYMQTAKLLRPELERIDGFIDYERFRSRRHEDRLLSLSTWRDEKAVVRWRAHGRHHVAGQRRGRLEIFRDYRLRVGEITSDTAPGAAPLPQLRFDETEVAAARAISITELMGEHDLVTPPEADEQLGELEWYESLLAPGRFLLLASWRTAGGAGAWTAPERTPGVRHRRVRVIREYGMRERREAPQYFPDVD